MPNASGGVLSGISLDISTASVLDGPAGEKAITGAVGAFFLGVCFLGFDGPAEGA